MSAKTESPQRDRKQPLKAPQSGPAARNKDLEAAKSEVQQTAKEFEAAFSAVAEAMVVYDASAEPVMANPAAVAAYGFDPSNSSRANILQKISLSHPNGKKVSLKELPSSRALKGEKVVNERYVFTNAEGKELTVLTSATPLVSKGRISGAVAIWRDVTERRTMETKFRKERARLETILESTPVGIVVADEKGRIVLANELAAALYGRSIPLGEGVESHYDLHLCYPDGRPYNPNDMPLTRSVFHGKSFSEVEMAVIWPDGTRKDLLVNSTPIRDLKGDVIGAVGVFQDVTVFMAQREELRIIKRDLEKRVEEQTAEMVRSKEVLESIINHIPVMLCFYDCDGDVKLINKEFEDRVGWRLDEVRGIGIMETCYPDEEYRQEVWEYMMEARPEWRDFKITTRDGNILDSSWANVRLSDRSQIGIGIDITQRLQYEESLRRRNRELEAEIAKREKFEKALKASSTKIIRQYEQRKHLSRRLVELLEKDRRDVAMFLHDEIGQLLTTLKMDLEIAERRPDDPVLVRERLGAAKEKTLEALGFVKHMSGELRPSTLDTLGFLASIRSLVSTIKDRADFEIHLFTKGLPERLESKKELALYRIVQESLTNVLKHSGADEVFINLTCRHGVVVLTVEDDGIGFDYHEMSNGTHHKESPLGITIMRERAVQCDGSFRIESQPGKGAQVMVEIPL